LLSSHISTGDAIAFWQGTTEHWRYLRGIYYQFTMERVSYIYTSEFRLSDWKLKYIDWTQFHFFFLTNTDASITRIHNGYVLTYSVFISNLTINFIWRKVIYQEDYMENEDQSICLRLSYTNLSFEICMLCEKIRYFVN